MQKPPNEKMSLGGSTIPVTYLLFDFSFVTGKSEAKVRQTIQVADIHFMHLFLFGKTPHVTFCTANNSTCYIKEAGTLGIPRHQEMIKWCQLIRIGIDDLFQLRHMIRRPFWERCSWKRRRSGGSHGSVPA